MRQPGQCGGRRSEQLRSIHGSIDGDWAGTLTQAWTDETLVAGVPRGESLLQTRRLGLDTADGVDSFSVCLCSAMTMAIAAARFSLRVVGGGQQGK